MKDLVGALFTQILRLVAYRLVVWFENMKTVWLVRIIENNENENSYFENWTRPVGSDKKTRKQTEI